MTEKRMRALVKEILARRTPAAPEDYAALQASRLNEALLVAYGAMSAENLKAVALVVRIVRELDRYHGFVAAGRRDPLVSGAAGEGQAPTIRPQMAPQALENMESAPENGALPHAFAAAPPQAENARSVRADAVGMAASNDASPPAPEPPRPGPAPRAPCAGAEMAPQPVENTDSAPGNDRAAAAAGPSEEPSPHADASASSAASPEEAPPPASPIEQPMEWPESTAVVLAPDSAAPGGFRRMRIQFLRNGVAACADPV